MSGASSRPSPVLNDSKSRVRTAGITLAAVVVVIAGLAIWRPVPMQAIAGGVSFLAVGVLAYITWLHVLSNEQLARTNQAILKTLSDDSYAFGLRQDGPNAILWIANLGHAHIMLHSLYLQSGEAQSSANYNEIVQAGHVVEVNSTKQVLELPKGASDIDVWFEFISASGTAISSVQTYNILVANGLVCRVRSGTYQPRSVECPTCHQKYAMSVTGLARTDDIEARSIEFKADLTSTCPAHRSQYLLKGDSVPASMQRSAAS
jgi:hypothetical protein